jgi:hypothetical protein
MRKCFHNGFSSLSNLQGSNLDDLYEKNGKKKLKNSGSHMIPKDILTKLINFMRGLQLLL